LLLLLLLLLQGYLVGNGCTDVHFDGNAQVPFALGKSLISASLYSRTNEACAGKFYDAPAGSRCGTWATMAVMRCGRHGRHGTCL
jgi:hypothetical protein